MLFETIGLFSSQSISKLKEEIIGLIDETGVIEPQLCESVTENYIERVDTYGNPGSVVRIYKSPRRNRCVVRDFKKSVISNFDANFDQLYKVLDF